MIRMMISAAVVVVLVACAGAAFTPTTFTALDPDVTPPSDFWMEVWNYVPENYILNPRYPAVPGFGPIGMDVLDTLYPNGTVPKVPAKPTNVWYKNLWGFNFDDDTNWNAVYPYPYIVWPKIGNISIMYSSRPIGDTGNRQIQQFFTPAPNATIGHPPIYNATYPAMVMSAGFDLGIQILNGLTPKMTNNNPLGAHVEYFDANNNSVATLYIVKGSPLVTIECRGALLAFGNNNTPPVLDANGATPGTTVSGKKFTLTTAAGPMHLAGTTWHAYFDSVVTITIPDPPTTPFHLSGPYTGVLQVGCGELNDEEGSFLDSVAGSFAKGASVKYGVDTTANKATVTFKFDKGGNTSKPLTMLALAHHLRLLPPATTTTNTTFWCVKGNLTGVTADQWVMKYNLTKAGFGDTFTVPASVAPNVLRAALLDYKLRISGCPGDNATYGYPGSMNMELYAYNRDLAQMVDIAIVLESLGHRTKAVKMSQQVLKCIAPVLARPKTPPHACPAPINGTVQCVRDQQDVYFDMRWGGLVTGWYDRFASHYCQCDKPGGPDACKGYNYCDNPRGYNPFSNYGNAFYNDHHFQYGYILKSLAWLIYFQTTKGAPLGMNATFIHNTTKKALAFARDIANPDPTADRFFPYLRHKDHFDGHSNAEGYDYSGRSLTWVNQQSGGEAINGYYGVYLLGVALNDTNVRDWGRINLATEMFSISQYQHLSNRTADKIDMPTKEINQWGKCLSILIGNGASGATYYGPNALFQCGITVLPITPITGEWINPDWAREAVEWMRFHANRSGICVFFNPTTMTQNPCPGQYPPTWALNEWACCPTNVGFPDNQWRAYPDWFPYMYYFEALYSPKTAFSKLIYNNVSQATKYLPFPYLNTWGDVVGFQQDLTMTSVLFNIATLGQQQQP